MTKYFYVLHGEFTPKHLNDDLDLLNHAEQVGVKQADYLLSKNTFESKQTLFEKSNRFRLDNGIDVRYLKHFGAKEITKERYERLLLQDKEIVANMSSESKLLLKQFGHNTHGWHYPFCIEAKDENELSHILMSTYPSFTVFEFL